MTDKVIVVTDPDDIVIDGLRILLVDLSLEHTQLISDALTKIDKIPTIITYMWQSNNSVDWLLDKKHKSWLIIFNADSQNDIVTGYLAAQRNSYYFGTLKNLSKANTRVINSSHELLDLLLLTIAKYE
jgi:hypothetical protein